MKQIFLIAILIFMLGFSIVAQTIENSCPQIKIIPPSEMLVPDRESLFTVTNGKETYEYNWTVSGGSIVKGQGTSKIELIVAPSDFGQNITITLEIDGLPKNCTNKISKTVGVIEQPNSEPFSQYGKISANDEKAQIENLYHYISINEGFEAVMLLEFDKKTPLDKRINRLREIIKWIEFRKFDKSRISFAVSEDASDYTTILLLREKSEIFEDLTKNYKLVKGEDLKRQFNEFFSRK